MYEYRFFRALLLTVSVEIIIVLLYYRSKKFDLASIEGGLKRLLPMVTFASIMTLPYVWFILPVFIRHRLPYIIIAEVSVISLEMFFYFIIFPCRLKTAFQISLLANLASFVFGKIFASFVNLK